MKNILVTRKTLAFMLVVSCCKFALCCETMDRICFGGVNHKEARQVLFMRHGNTGKYAHSPDDSADITCYECGNAAQIGHVIFNNISGDKIRIRSDKSTRCISTAQQLAPGKKVDISDVDEELRIGLTKEAFELIKSHLPAMYHSVVSFARGLDSHKSDLGIKEAIRTQSDGDARMENVLTSFLRVIIGNEKLKEFKIIEDDDQEKDPLVELDARLQDIGLSIRDGLNILVHHSMFCGLLMFCDTIGAHYNVGTVAEMRGKMHKDLETSANSAMKYLLDTLINCFTKYRLKNLDCMYVSFMKDEQEKMHYSVLMKPEIDVMQLPLSDVLTVVRGNPYSKINTVIKAVQSDGIKLTMQFCRMSDNVNRKNSMLSLKNNIEKEPMISCIDVLKSFGGCVRSLGGYILSFIKGLFSWAVAEASA